MEATQKEDRRTYKSAGLDGADLEGSFSGDGVNKFVMREGLGGF